MSLAKVVLVEDDNFSRTLLENLLQNEKIEVWAVASASEAMQLVEDQDFGAAVLDVDLGPGPTGVDLAHAIRSRKPGIGLVFLSSFPDHRLSRAAGLRLPEGSRYLSKGELRQGSVLVRTVLSACLEPLKTKAEIRNTLPLSARQLTVLRQVAIGLTNAEIAKQLGVSEKSVEHVISRILTKLGIPKNGKLNPRVLLAQAYSELSGKPAPS